MCPRVRLFLYFLLARSARSIPRGNDTVDVHFFKIKKRTAGGESLATYRSPSRTSVAFRTLADSSSLRL